MTGADVTERPNPSWAGEDVAIHDVVKAVEDLRRGEQHAATRTSVATLTIVSRTPEEVEAAGAVVDHLGARHPARVINLLAPRGAGEGEDRVDAAVTLHAGKAAGHEIWSDELKLTVSGGPARHLASLLRPLQLSDLPVVVWYVSGLPDPGDPLLKSADAVIFDSKTFVSGSTDDFQMHQAFSQVAALTRRHTLIDLSWIRLSPWRRLLAGQFEGDAFRPFASGVHRVEVTGKVGPRILLAGWLGSRLHLDRDQFSLHDSRHVTIRLHARAHDTEASFFVERVAEERLVRAEASIAGGPSHDEVVTLPEDTLPLALAGSLRRLERDRVWEQAVKLAGAWL